MKRHICLKIKGGSRDVFSATLTGSQETGRKTRGAGRGWRGGGGLTVKLELFRTSKCGHRGSANKLA